MDRMQLYGPRTSFSFIDIETVTIIFSVNLSDVGMKCSWLESSSTIFFKNFVILLNQPFHEIETMIIQLFFSVNSIVTVFMDGMAS